MLQETKCKRKGTLKIENYTIFENIRSNNFGGGLLTAVHNSLSPVCVSEGVDVEILVVECKLKGFPVRFINAYGKQETDSEEERFAFFRSLDFEIKSAFLKGSMVCVELDANSKIGYENFARDPHPQSQNGKFLMKVVHENSLIIVNTLDICEGLITRKRKVLERIEESIIDYILVCPQFLSFVKKMYIDEKRIYSLGSYHKTGKGSRGFLESDHNLMMLELDLSLQLNLDQRKVRTEVYNFKNNADFQKYVDFTTLDDSLVQCFENDEEDFQTQCQNWLSCFNSIFKKFFKRIRITNKKKNFKLESLMKEKERLKTQIENNIYEIQ